MLAQLLQLGWGQEEGKGDANVQRVFRVGAC